MPLISIYFRFVSAPVIASSQSSSTLKFVRRNDLHFHTIRPALHWALCAVNERFALQVHAAESSSRRFRNCSFTPSIHPKTTQRLIKLKYLFFCTFSFARCPPQTQNQFSSFALFPFSIASGHHRIGLRLYHFSGLLSCLGF